MGAYYLCWCLGFLFIPNLDAKSFKLVPGTTKTITTNGVTHEISRYMVVPDDQNNETIARATKLQTANENGVDKETTDTNSDHITDNQRVKARTANETHTENVRNNIIKTLRMMRASQYNAGEYKSTETPTLDKYQSSYRSRSDSNINHGDHKVVRIRNTTKYNGKGSVKHTKVTLNLKPQSKVSQSKLMYIKHNNEGMNKQYMDGASEFITQNQYKIPVSKTISNQNVHTSESKEAGINNLNAKEKLIEAIGINEMFTMPGKRGRYKLVYEENVDQENDDQKINTIQHSRQPKHTVSHFYGTKNILNEQKDFSLESLNFATPADSVLKTNLNENIKHNNLNNINNLHSSYIDDNNVSIVGETSHDKHGLDVVTGKINLQRKDSENEHLDAQILSESQNNFVSTEPMSNEKNLHNAQVFKNDLNVLPLTDNNTNSQNDLSVLPLQINDTTNSNIISTHEDRYENIYPYSEEQEIEHEVESVPRQDLEDQEIEHEVESVPRQDSEEQEIKYEVESVPRQDLEVQGVEHQVESVPRQDSEEPEIDHKVESVPKKDLEEQQIRHQVESIQKKNSEEQEITHQVESVPRQDLEEQEIEHKVESVPRQDLEEQVIEHQVEYVKRKDSQEQEMEHEVESVPRQDLEEQEIEHEVESVPGQDLEEQVIEHQVESVQRKDSEEQEIEHQVESVPRQDLEEQVIEHQVEYVKRKDSQEQEMEHEVESVPRQDLEEQEIEHEVESVPRQDLEEQVIEHQVESVQRKDSEDQEIEHQLESVQRKDSEEQEIEHEVESVQRKDSEEQEIEHQVESVPRQDLEEQEIEHEVESVPRQDLEEQVIEHEVESVPRQDLEEQVIEHEVESVKRQDLEEQEIEHEVESVPRQDSGEQEIEHEVEFVQRKDSEEQVVEHQVESVPRQDSEEPEIEHEVESVPRQDLEEQQIEHEVKFVPRQDLQEQQIEHQVESVQRKDSEEQEIKHQVESVPRQDSEEPEMEHEVESVPRQDSEEQEIEYEVESVQRKDSEEQEIEHEVGSVQRKDSEEQEIEHEVESVPRQDLEEQQIEHEVESVHKKDSEDQEFEHEVESVAIKSDTNISDIIEEPNKDDKEKTDELSDNNNTAILRINYAAAPEDNLGLEQTHEDVNKDIRTVSSEQVNPSRLEQAGSQTTNLAEIYTLREKLKSSLEIVEQLDNFYHDIHKATTESDNSNYHEHKPEIVDLNFKLDTPSEALTVEIKHENQPSQLDPQPIANYYDGGENQDYKYDEIDGKTPTPVQIIYSEDIRPNRGYSPDYTPALSPFPYRFRNTEAYFSQNAYSQPNYSNYRNPYVISEQYFQKILTFLGSEKVMQLLRLKSEIGYGDTDTIRKSHIIEQLRNLGLDNMNSIQLLVRHLEANKKYNQKVTQYDPISVAQYYYMPHAKVYPTVLSQNYAYQRYLLPNIDVKFNTAIRTLVSKAMNIATYLRIQGVPKSQITFYLSEVHKHLNNIAVQSYLKNCRKRIITGLGLKIDFLARQAMSSMF